MFYYCCKICSLRNNSHFLLKIIHQTLEQNKWSPASLFAGIQLYWISCLRSQMIDVGPATSYTWHPHFIEKLWTTEHIPPKTHQLLWNICLHGRINIGKGANKEFQLKYNDIVEEQPWVTVLWLYMLLIRADLLHVFEYLIILKCLTCLYLSLVMISIFLSVIVAFFHEQTLLRNVWILKKFIAH